MRRVIVAREAPILLAHAKQQIDDEAKGLETGLVFMSVHGKIRDPNASKKVWIELCTDANIGHRIGPQVMRRSLNTMMLAEGVDRITLRAIMGHASEEMTQRYAGIGDEAKAEAIERVRPALRIVRSAAAVEQDGVSELEPGDGARAAS